MTSDAGAMVMLVLLPLPLGGQPIATILANGQSIVANSS